METEATAKRLESLQEQVKRLKLVQYLTGAMNSVEDHHELLEMMLSQCVKLTNSTSGSIMTKSEDSKVLKFETYMGISEDVAAKTVITIGEGVTGLCVQEGVARLVNDVSLEPKYIPVHQDVKSELVVPILIDGEAVGVISVDSDRTNAYTEEDLDLMQAIANQSAQIISRNLLYETLEHKIKLKDLLIDITNKIEDIPDLKESFNAIMQILGEEFNITRGMLVLFETGGAEHLSIYSAYNLLQEEISRGNYKVGEGIIGKAVQTGKTIAIADINRDQDFLNRMQVKRDKSIPTSFIAAPIPISGVVSGVLAVEKPFEGREILSDEEDIITLVAKSISTKVKIFQQMQLEKEMLMEENRELRKQLVDNYQFSNIIGKNAKMQELFELVSMVADSASSVLISGESGTGKELVARSLHYNSSRKDKPFISINCAAIPEALLESELFGHKKGSFTGATSDKKGKFVLANEGTLFLDEIGDMPLYLQAKLLRAIQEKEVEPVGSEEKVKVDIRIVSATHQDLNVLIEQGKFRSDLFYRLNVIGLEIPPLRDRKDDIPLLVMHFIRKYAELNARSIDRFSAEALRVLQGYGWPGNVRELENVIERSVLLCRTNTIEVSNLPATLTESVTTDVNDVNIGKWVELHIKDSSNSGKVYSETISKIEREVITQALLYNKRNKVKTSEFLGINRNTLRSKMLEYGINV